MKKKKVFQYLGKEIESVKNITGSFQEISRRLGKEIHIAGYNYDDFYSNSRKFLGGEWDVYLMDGKKIIACTNSFFEYKH